MTEVGEELAMFRPVTLMRRVRPIAGAPRITVRLRPRFDWGREEPVITQGSHHNGLSVIRIRCTIAQPIHKFSRGAGPPALAAIN